MEHEKHEEKGDEEHIEKSPTSKENKEEGPTSKENKEEHSAPVEKPNLTKKMRENPWMLSTFVLVVLAVILLTGSFGGITGKTISENKVGELALTFFNGELSQTPGTLDSVESVSGIYQVNININGESVPLYFTQDGNWIAQGGDLVSVISKSTPNSQTETQAEGVETLKADIPKVELIITSYCPYGLQAAKGMLPVAELLEGKINFKIKYFNIPSHGEKEEIEGKRQICIREYQSDKFLDYVECFVGSGDFEACLTSTAIDRTKLDNCMNNDIQNYYSGTSEMDVDVGSSPTLIINGVQIQSARDPMSYLDTICKSFTDENVPEECGEQLSSASPTPGFGWDETSTTTSAQC